MIDQTRQIAEKNGVMVVTGQVKNNERSSPGTRSWKPISLRLPFLISVLSVTAALIVGLQWLLYRSQSQGGVLFADNINDLPLSKTFGYLYAPTIIAVVYGLLWNWIDLDIKRMEPYFQLCSPSGALAEESLLLQYPFDFVILVPFEAARRKHWSVFSAGLAVVIVLWTLTPLQAGIFATESRVVTTPTPFVSSTSYLPVSRQTEISSLYAQQAYNIAWLNATLPPYMTRDAILSPFAPSLNETIGNNEIWNGTTELYSLDITCEATINYRPDPIFLYYNSSYGCSYLAPSLQTLPNNDTSKFVEALYVGYQNQNGMADYYLSTDCPKSASHTFLVRTAILSADAIANDSASLDNATTYSATALYCQPSYYVQTVNASVAAANGSVISTTPTSEKKALSTDIFDIDKFEWAMSSGQIQDFTARGHFPTYLWPEQKSHFVDTPLDMAYLPRMVPFSFASLQMPSLESYMDPEILRKSYQAAYRLLFVTQMADILQPDYGTAAARHIGQRAYQTQAVVLVPGFVYSVEALLAVAMVFLCSITYFTVTRSTWLQFDPIAMVSSMSAVAGDPHLLRLFSNLDMYSSKCLAERLKGSHYSMSSASRLELLDGPDLARIKNPKNTTNTKGVQPPELRWYSGAISLVVQLLCVIVIGYLFHWAQTNNGIPLPSNNQFVLQILENYVPTAVATSMEPFWILITRQICILQPFEELRKGGATSMKSINLDYTSLPPQLVMFRAFRARHFTLATMCVMTLLANVLSVAFSGLFYENTVSHEVESDFQPLLSLPFLSLNGTGAPFNSNISEGWQGGTTMDEFYIAMSNAVDSSELPSWTDPRRFYFPVQLPNNEGSTTNYTLTTTYFEAALDCQEFKEHGTGDRIDFDVRYADGSIHNCSTPLPDSTSLSGQSALEFVTLADETDLCRQYVLAGWWRASRSNNSTEITNKTTILCHPTLSTGIANVTVTGSGTVLQAEIVQSANGWLQEFFTTTPADLVLQAHLFIIDSNSRWHNDSFSSDWQNYLIAETSVGDRFLDPSQEAPHHAEATSVFAAMYSKLFAILLGNNKDLLFTDVVSSLGPVSGQRIQSEKRIFLSLSAFIIAEIILGLYVITTVVLYIRRPWRILPRLPTTIASTIAFFAASYALKDFEETAHMSTAEHRKWLEHLDYRWAYGKFMGTDRHMHVGVEREPFVNLLQKESIPRIKGWDEDEQNSRGRP